MGRLTEVKRVVDNLAVESLVRYGYDANGQLNQVISRNGDMVLDQVLSALAPAFRRSG
ncbi:hypothetical protein PsexTeo8_21430 [Pseudomonas extremaustralis]|nr:hypothetical protein [Pseudomonas extremaustralis]